MASTTMTTTTTTLDDSNQKKSAKRRRKKMMLLHELVKTEETYVAALQKLVYEFVLPLSSLRLSKNVNETSNIRSSGINRLDPNSGAHRDQSCKGSGVSSMSTDECLHARSILKKRYGSRGIFQGLNAREILGLNQCLLIDLKKNILPLLSRNKVEPSLCNGDDERIDSTLAKLFLRYTPQMAMYSLYCESHQTILERIEIARDSACVDGYFSVIEQNVKCSLQSLLIQPVQRLPRYKMLLAELIKNSYESLDTSSTLEKALSVIADIAQRVNEQLRSFEERKKVFSLSRRIAGCPDLIAPSRIFVRSGILTKVSRAWRSRQYHFFLFSDGTLVYASPVLDATGSRFSQARNGAQHKSISNRNSIEQASERFTFRRKITVLGVKRKPDSASILLTGTPKSINVCASTISEANEWCKAFKTCLQNLVDSPMWSQGKRQSVQNIKRRSSPSLRMNPGNRGNLNTLRDRGSTAWNLEARSKT